MGKTIEAKAVITASDNTGAVFDQVAKKIEGISKAAANFKGLPPLTKVGWSGAITKELEQLKMGGKELQIIQRSWENFNKALFSKGPPRAAIALDAMKLWNNETLKSLRQVRAGYEETDRAHEKYMRSVTGRMKHAAHFAMGAAGIGGGIYAAERGIHALAHRAGDRSREEVRYAQGGLTGFEYARANKIADEISARHPSIGRTDVLKYMRKNTARLGSFDRAELAAEPFARAMIANKLAGGDEHELEQVTLALEGMGKANTADQLTSGLQGFMKAKALNPDYTGDKFAKDMRAASASKYGMSKDYAENVFPFLAAHAPGFGNTMATGFNALIGNHQQKKAIAALTKDGLIDKKSGLVIDEKGWIQNNFDWTQKHIKPLLEKQLGVNFSEDMSEDDKGKVAAWATRHFSARKTADLITTNLLDAPLVEKARKRRVPTLEAMDSLQRKDAGLAYESVKQQSGDLGTALMNLDPIVKGLNKFSDALAGITNRFNQGSTADKAGMLTAGTLLGGGAAAGGVLGAKSLYQWFTGSGALTGAATALEGSAAALTRAAFVLAGGSKAGTVTDVAKAAAGPTAAATGGWLARSVPIAAALTMPLMLGGDTPEGQSGAMQGTIDDEVAKFRRGRDFTLGSNRTFGTNMGSDSSFIRSRGFRDPAHSDFQNVRDAGPLTVQLDGHASVEGQATIVVKIEAPELIRAVADAKSIVQLKGSLQANGPGSTGRSSPDAGAPSRPAPAFDGVP